MRKFFHAIFIRQTLNSRRRPYIFICGHRYPSDVVWPSRRPDKQVGTACGEGNKVLETIALTLQI